MRITIYLSHQVAAKWNNAYRIQAHTHTHSLPMKWRQKRKGKWGRQRRPKECPLTLLWALRSRRTGPCLLYDQWLYMLSKQLMMMRQKRRRRGKKRRWLPTCLLKESTILYMKSLKSYKALMEMLQFQDIFSSYFKVLEKAKKVFYLRYYSFFKLFLVFTSC